MILSSLTQLSAKQKRWVWTAWWRLWWVQLRLKFGRSSWLSSLLQGAEPKLTGPDQQRLALALHESIRLAARAHPLKVECLPKSIVLVTMLKNMGIESKLCLGIAKQDSASSADLRLGFSSHAWVELADGPIGESDSLARDFELVNTRL